jgi:hypothetical protein
MRWPRALGRSDFYGIPRQYRRRLLGEELPFLRRRNTKTVTMEDAGSGASLSASARFPASSLEPAGRNARKKQPPRRRFGYRVTVLEMND